MPEIAEVRLISDNISTFLKGNVIKSIELRDPTTLANWAKRGAKGLNEIQNSFPLRVLEVKTKGKFCWMELENNWSVMIQFGMSGNIRKEPTDEYLPIYNASQTKPLTREQYLKHCHLKITYCMGADVGDPDTTERVIYYHDIRRFGSWVFTPDPSVLQKKLDKLGHDPLQEPALQEEELLKRFRRHNHKPICKALMEQEAIFAGVGNYIRVETMYAAKINPFAKIKDIPDDALIELYGAIRDIALSAYQSGGASLYTYTGMNGDQTEFKATLRVYKQATDPLGNPVVHVPDKQVPGNRSLFWVPAIQTIGKPAVEAKDDPPVAPLPKPTPKLANVTRLPKPTITFKNKNSSHGSLIRPRAKPKLLPRVLE